MSTEPSGWQSPKTNWTPDDNIGASDLNRWEGNCAAIETGERTLDPAQAPSSNKGSLRQILDWLANRIKAISGAANWYSAPATTLAAAKSHMDAAAPHSGHVTTTAFSNHVNANITSSTAVHGIKQGAGNGFDADTLDGFQWESMASGSQAIAAGQTWSKAVGGSTGTHYILASVDTSGQGGSLLDHESQPPSGASGWWISRVSGLPYLYIKNNTDKTFTYNYRVMEWG